MVLERILRSPPEPTWVRAGEVQVPIPAQRMGEGNAIGQTLTGTGQRECSSPHVDSSSLLALLRPPRPACDWWARQSGACLRGVQPLQHAGGDPPPVGRGVSSMPFRLLNKGPAYFRRPLVEPGARKLSAVERLEADKAKYVKSQQVVLTRQAPIKPPHCSPAAGSTKTPIIRKPLLTPAMQGQMATPPARKVPRRPIAAETGAGGGAGGDRGAGGRRGPVLNLEILNNLINNVSDAAQTPTTPTATITTTSRSSDPSCFSSSSSSSSSSSPTSSSPSPSGSSPSSGAKSIGSSLSAEPRLLLLNNLKPLNTSSSLSSSSTSSPLNNKNNINNNTLPPPVPARAPRAATPPYPRPHPHPMAVRRVDVRPPAAPTRTFSPRPALPLKPTPPRQTAQPQAPPSLPPPPPPPPPHRTMTTSSPSSSSSPSSRRMPQAPAPPYPPPSPAFTRLSATSSSRGGGASPSGRKPPALHRSKSDLSDRYSRATADLERFFNYCGLAPGEVEALGGVERFARANSDIVSVSKLRSVSTPSSECDGGGEGPGDEVDGEGEGPARGNERVPYGISVIERNARVIKWLYGIRQARDASQGVSNV
ncbi:hypothetical protein CRUP_035244 [Coryphaenoides rupestris]|nr:hypothetical protein CRUP_035244 [Coryphaenoides rupestris]